MTSPGIVTEIVREYVRARQSEKQGKRSKRDAWSLSQTFTCPRKQVMARSGDFPADPVTDESMAVFEAGDMYEDFVHRALTERIESMGYQMFFQVRVSCSAWNAMGTLDFLLLCPDGTWELIDTKSASNKNFMWLKTHDSEKNVGQVTGYAYGLSVGEMALTKGIQPGCSIRVDRVRLAYVNKDTGEVMEKLVDWKKELPSVVDYYRALNQMWWDYKHAHPGATVLPPEIPFRNGAPHPLCSPKHCVYIKNCGTIRAWYEEKSTK